MTPADHGSSLHLPRLRVRPAFRALLALAALAVPATAQRPDSLEPVHYTVTIDDPASHRAHVKVLIPTAGMEHVELMMPVWSPGFYRVEDYATRVRDFSARVPDGDARAVAQTLPNRWRVLTGRSPAVLVSYDVVAEERSVTTDWVGEGLAVLNGAPTFATPLGMEDRPHDVRLVLPAGWTASTALDPAPDGAPLHYRAPGYDALVDAPIVAGRLAVHSFDVDGIPHLLADAGDVGEWDGARAVPDLEAIVRVNARLWGGLPYRRYVFLNVFRRGGGGLEHAASTLLTANASRLTTPQGYRRWLAFVSHEYAHAFNVKRLRPVELGPFDYEDPPRTRALWEAEGFTSYYGNLAMPRAGLEDADAYLASLSRTVRSLQQSPGRLAQTVEASSLEVWSNSLSGVNPDSGTVSYYVKGEVIAWLLDAKVRRATGGERSLDDVMRLAYRRYSGERGFTTPEFAQTASEVAGADLAPWFHTVLATTEELDYAEALDWFGLRFTDGDAGPWTLEVRPGTTAAQAAHVRSWLTPEGWR